MEDKKLSAYDVLTEMSADDFFVILQALGGGAYTNKNIRFSDLLNAVAKKDLSNVELSDTVRNSLNLMTRNLDNPSGAASTLDLNTLGISMKDGSNIDVSAFLTNLGFTQIANSAWGSFSGDETTGVIGDSSTRIGDIVFYSPTMKLGFFVFKMTSFDSGSFKILTPPDSITLRSASIYATSSIGNIDNAYMRNNHIGLYTETRTGGNGKIGICVAEKSRKPRYTTSFTVMLIGAFRTV